MPRQRKWGNFIIENSVADAFSNARSEIEELHGEMESWRDNLDQCEGLNQTSKYEEVDEATNYLETANDTLSNLELERYGEKIKYAEHRKSGYPRWVRLSNAVAALEAIGGWMETYMESIRENSKMTDEDQGYIDEAEELVSDIQEATGELENVSFPGMF